MADLKPIVPKYLNRIVVVCSECDERVYAPSGNCVYKYCYNCGAKFVNPVSAAYINKVKNLYDYKDIIKEQEENDK